MVKEKFKIGQKSYNFFQNSVLVVKIVENSGNSLLRMRAAACIISAGYAQYYFYIFSTAIISLPSKIFVHVQMIHIQFLRNTENNNNHKFCTKRDLSEY